MKTVNAWVLSCLIGMCLQASHGLAGTTAQGEKGRILVVITNYERYPSRRDTTELWLTELTPANDLSDGFLLEFLAEPNLRHDDYHRLVILRHVVI